MNSIIEGVQYILDYNNIEIINVEYCKRSKDIKIHIIYGDAATHPQYWVGLDGSPFLFFNMKMVQQDVPLLKVLRELLNA